MEANHMTLADQMVEACYSESTLTHRELECLVYLIRDGDVKTWEELADYGVEKPIELNSAGN